MPYNSIDYLSKKIADLEILLKNNKISFLLVDIVNRMRDDIMSDGWNESYTVRKAQNEKSNALRLNIESEDLWEKVYNLIDLEELEIFGPNLNVISSSIGNLKNLRRLKITKSRITKLPIELGELSNLEELHLSNGAMKVIPKEVFRLKKLTKLILSSNEIREIPFDLIKKSQLRYLDLSNNKIRKIPSLLNQFVTLEYLNLSNNLISEVVPEVAALKSLKVLHLNNNKIDSVPIALFSLEKLVSLTFHNNPLKEMPEILDMGLIEMMQFFNGFDGLNFFIRVEESLKTSFQQYLLFFKDYVRIAKQESIYFEVERIDSGLIIKTRSTKSLDLDRIKIYLEEFLDFARKNFVDVIKVEGNVDPREIDILKMNIELQINNLNMQIKFKDWKINNLEKTNENLLEEKSKLFDIIHMKMKDEFGGRIREKKTSLIKKGQPSFSDKRELKEHCIKQLLNNRINRVCSSILDYSINNHDELLKHQITLISNRFSRLKNDLRLNLISYNEFDQKISEISNGVLELLDEDEK